MYLLKRNTLHLLLLLTATMCTAQFTQGVQFVFDKNGLRKVGGTPGTDKLTLTELKVKDVIQSGFDKKSGTYRVNFIAEKRNVMTCIQAGFKDPLFTNDNTDRLFELTFSKNSKDDANFSGLGIATRKYTHYVFGIKAGEYKIGVMSLGSSVYREIKGATACSKINLTGPNTLAASRLDNKWTFMINSDTVFTFTDTENPDFEDYPMEVYTDGPSGNQVHAFKTTAYHNNKPKPVVYRYKGSRPFNEDEFRERLRERYIGVLLSFSEGLMVVRSGNGNYAAVDSNGTEIIPALYQSLGSFHNALAPAKLGSKYGYIDMTGKYVIELNDYASCYSFSEGFAVVSKLNGGPFAYIDVTGKLVTDFVYERAREFENGKAKVTRNGVTMYLNTQMQEEK